MDWKNTLFPLCIAVVVWGDVSNYWIFPVVPTIFSAVLLAFIFTMIIGISLKISTKDAPKVFIALFCVLIMLFFALYHVGMYVTTLRILGYVGILFSFYVWYGVWTGEENGGKRAD